MDKNKYSKILSYLLKNWAERNGYTSRRYKTIISREYKRDLDDWKQLCRKYPIKFDRNRNG